MIEYNEVTKVFGKDVRAVDNVSFKVESGDIVVLLGPSGCGKTTLLRMVNRLESITEGNILVNNQRIADLNEIELRREIGYVIQSNGLFPNMTIEQNVTIVPNLLGWDKEKKEERYQYLMNLVGMDPDDYRKRYPHELSGGQQQRIGVIRALAADPPAMLMDEPFGALDPIIREKVQDEFLAIQRELHKTVLFVSHDINEAIKMGDKIALLRDGKLMQYDTPANILQNPANDFVAQFVGQDRTIKSLSIHYIEDLMKHKQLNETTDQKFSKQVPVNMNLRDALGNILESDEKEVAVTDENQKVIGSIDFSLISQYVSELSQ
ncbi:ABC transporter ATP-binding protein [Tenuibacillus multivorans]|uniref:Quaternary amine transport ATP-binding protein n=1 Tax=Tenuibacillus multivorans TaxID=237069 RepID=A0A1H0DKQ4_9BACI|nr:ABC transporter ATP-binding protein [Tenuibacillus multivorans]GEL76512.1 glycine/betaine ABC transporter ATP-binding protein [Tenuibacillus multivorans]SDN70722.1 osmoprotectant transport system ATP-binding protein [Tenuibacillus multivorans]